MCDPVPKCDCDDKVRGDRPYAMYYDSPDGCDIPTKIAVTTRYGIVAGLILGTYDVLMYSHAVGVGRMFTRYMRHVAPLGLMGATFAAVANTALVQRQVDDSLNYFLGGLACGPILAVYLRTKHALILGGLFLGMAGKLKKDAVESDVSILFPENRPHMGMVNSWRHDFTIVDDPRNEHIRKCSITKPAEEVCKFPK